MRLADLVHAAGLEAGSGSAPIEDSIEPSGIGELDIAGITLHSSAVEPGFLFAALPGHRAHGATFVPQAIAAGAIAVLTDAHGARLLQTPDVTTPDVTTLVVADPRAAVAQLACAFWQSPTESLTMVGVTGTNGKTTITHLVQAGLVGAGVSCGVIGTLGADLPGHISVTNERTTPEAPDLQATLAEMLRLGAGAVAMEVSSISLQEHRVDGITFDVAAFSGLTHDHLDYHGTMEAYFEAKAQLFEPLRARHGVVVIDDNWGRALVDRAAIPLTTVSGQDPDADWFVTNSGDQVSVIGPDQASVRMPIAGDFALTNLAVSVAVCHHLGVPAQRAADAAVDCRVPGRMEVVDSAEGIDFIVDYAHTPDAIDRMVAMSAQTVGQRGGRVIVVVGAGGDRDPAKREGMGRAAASHADLLIVTDDNPRSEDPATIRAAVLAGTTSLPCRVVEVAERADAIERAVQEAQRGDVVLILGKGHEATQEVAGHVFAFDDRTVLASFVRRRFGGGEEGGQR
ncbi:MAG: UDP-N-acetylmuramoyl-L-alanyl-D-glutamate--2,6-diaminopimelate ligase [Candidatus Nanopelagicales bacterium]